MERYRRSMEYLQRAMKVTPGAAQTLSKSPKRFPQGAFPVVLHDGYKARVQDIDGNEYVDWIGCLGANPLGYSNDHVNQASARAIANGALFSLPHYSELNLAERLYEKIPCAEMVRFVSSGSEATEAAIRTARIATGRDIILTVKDGYHSWHSWFQAVKDWHPGVPHAYTKVIHGLPYNDLSAWQQSFEMCDVEWCKVAAAILEPCLFEKPKDGFLQGIRDLCTRYGALMIMDEMVTGYRWALAGGQEYFGVTPDLATYGKGMSGGLPIGMLCGKREYMQHAELISGTFGGNAVSLAAANAVLDVYESDPVIETMWKRGQELQDYFNGKAFAMLLDKFAMADGYPCKPRFKFLKVPNENRSATKWYSQYEVHDLAMSLFLQVTAEHGALFHPGGLNVCYALSDSDMEVTFKAINKGLESVCGAIKNNDWSALKGDIIKPVVTVRQ